MPTIQFRTDDKTKSASTALFNKLGITMSEAINLFLRQSIMRGGIPFSITVPKKSSEEPEDDFAASLVDALRRYKTLNNAEFDLSKVQPLLQSLQALDIHSGMQITFYEDAAKLRFQYKEQEFVIDYNFDEPKTVFILNKKEGKLFVKDCPLADISKTLELF
jgi:DNA-damage-inducible protein J